jgi:hypothetical protein
MKGGRRVGWGINKVNGNGRREGLKTASEVNWEKNCFVGVQELNVF